MLKSGNEGSGCNGEGKRFVVQADDKLTAFLELDGVIARAAFCFDRLVRFLPNSTSLNGSESGGGLMPRQVLRLFRTRNRKITKRGTRKEEP